MSINTLEDVRVFIMFLGADDLLWHADDDATDCLSHRLTQEQCESMQAKMDQAIAICKANGKTIWDYYPPCDDEEE